MGFLIPLKTSVTSQILGRNSNGQDELQEKTTILQHYSDSSWLEEANQQKIIQISNKQTYWTRFFGVSTALLCGLATVHVPFIRHLNWKIKAGVVVVPALMSYFAAGYFLNAANLKEYQKIILEGDMIPCWSSEDRVIEKDKVYFHLDDDRGFMPSILYHGISEKQIDNILPDRLFGNMSLSKTYLDKFKHLMANKDHNKTTALVEELSLSPKAVREGGEQH